MGLVRTLWLASTLVVAGPATLVGFLHALEGRYPEGAMFVGLALLFVLVSEYAYRHFVDRTVGRLKRLTGLRKGRDPGE